MKTLIKDDFIPLTDDILFKHIFGSSKNTKFIEDFLECYFNYPKGYLKNKVKVNSEALIDKLNYHRLVTLHKVFYTLKEIFIHSNTSFILSDV